MSQRLPSRTYQYFIAKSIKLTTGVMLNRPGNRGGPDITRLGVELHLHRRQYAACKRITNESGIIKADPGSERSRNFSHGNHGSLLSIHTHGIDRMGLDECRMLYRMFPDAGSAAQEPEEQNSRKGGKPCLI
ncbi:MAG: hypothetical protein Q4B17_08890 [Lautropia sp.]|nr:hypothetical protein [Lautropia sp.]